MSTTLAQLAVLSGYLVFVRWIWREVGALDRGAARGDSHHTHAA